MILRESQYRFLWGIWLCSSGDPFLGLTPSHLESLLQDELTGGNSRWSSER